MFRHVFETVKNLLMRRASVPLPSTIGRRSKITAELLKASQKKVGSLLEELEASPQGLTEEAAADRLETFGLNEILHEKPPPWYLLLWRNLLNPLNLLLLSLSAISFVLGDYQATVIIAFMIMISVGIRFFQEFRSNLATEKLKAMVSTTATVFRRESAEARPKKREIPMKFLVPGDTIALAAGDMVPGDVRLISSKELFVSQAALTGEAFPVEKFEGGGASEAKGPKSPLELANICFMGTNVINGTATAVILSTGSDTFFGSLSKTIFGHRPLTSFDIGVNRVTMLLIKFMFVMIPVVFLINGLTKHDWLEALLFSFSVAVGLTPEMLPMIVTANLANGAVNMSKHKVIVKRLNAIQNFGAMDVLCTDKTGTLTQDRVILERHISLEGEENDEVLEYAYLNSYYQTGLKNLLDIAVLEHAELKQQLHIEEKLRKIDEIPFDFSRRRMSVVVEKTVGKHLLITKGSMEEILPLCREAKIGGSIFSLSSDWKEKAKMLKDELNEEGLRVLAVAYKEIDAEADKEYKAKDEESLVLVGYIAFLDPPKQTTEAALRELRKNNVKVKVLTGDNETVTRKICKWVGLQVDASLQGLEVEEMDEQELCRVVEETTIFTKLTPQQKSRIIQALKSNGHIVGYLGDGINDAPALREADVGISVDTAVDIAKESADIIMLEKSLLFLSEGVIEGRKTFGNIQKYIKMAASSNFGNVLSVLGSSIFLPFLPMQPLQLLIQNLLYDLSQISIPFDSVDKEFLEKPRKWDPGGLANFMIFIGPISSIFDYTTFAIMWFIFEANSVEKQSLFQSGWFVEGLLTQTLIVHMLRTQKIPFFQSIASLPLLLTTILVMLFGIYIPYSFFHQSIDMTPLPLSYFAWLLATLLCYCILTQVVKVWYMKRFRNWL